MIELRSTDVALVDDHLLVAETVATALRHRGLHVAIVGPRERSALIAAVAATRARLVLLDRDLGEYGDSTPLIAPLTAAGLPVLVVSGTSDRLDIARAVEQGAIGYQPKAAGFDALLTAVSAVLAGAAMLTDADRAALRAELAEARTARERRHRAFRALTSRERNTLHALAEGHTVHEIAHDWVLSEATVRTHVRGVLVKLGVTSQLAAVAAARRNGWLGSGHRTTGRPEPI